MRTISAREAASAGLAAAAMVAELVMWASFHPKTLCSRSLCGDNLTLPKIPG